MNAQPKKAGSRQTVATSPNPSEAAPTTNPDGRRDSVAMSTPTAVAATPGTRGSTVAPMLVGVVVR